MTVKELIKKLEQYDPDLDVWVADECAEEATIFSFPLAGVQVNKKPSDFINNTNSDFVLMIRWNDYYEEFAPYYIHHYSEAKQQEIRDCGYLIKEDGSICWSQEQVDRIHREGAELFEKLKNDSRMPATPMDD